MRRIPVDNVRRKRAVKHGGNLQRVEWSSFAMAAETGDDHVLAMHDALDKLAARDPPGAELIKLRFFAGLPNVEAAEVLGNSERTAKRTWSYASASVLVTASAHLAWLTRAIRSAASLPQSPPRRRGRQRRAAVPRR